MALLSVYNPRIYNVNALRSMFPFRNDRPLPISSLQAEKYIPLLKKSDARWEDLGWAWGKRSAPFAVDSDEQEDSSKTVERQVRSLKQVKKNPDWHDLGWAWGRKWR